MKSNSLHRFILALNKTEKRSCFISIQRNKSLVEKGFLILFQTLSKMDVYDEALLKKKLNGTQAGKQLALSKHRLYKLLLDEVKRVRNQQLKSNNPRRCLEEAEVLLSLQMLEEAEEVLKRGLDFIVKHEDLQLEVLLRDLLRIVYKNMDHKNLVDARTQNEYQLVMATKKLARWCTYVQINDRMFDYLRNYRVTSAKEVKEGVEELINQPEMKAVHQANSLASQIRYHRIWQMYYSQKNDLDKTIENLKRLVQLYESDEEAIRKSPSEYASVLSSLAGKLILSGKVDEAMEQLHKMEHTPIKDRRTEVVLFGYSELQYQLYYLNRGMLDEVLAREERMMENINRYGNELNTGDKLAMLYNLGVANMLCGNYGRAKRAFDDIRGMKKTEVRKDLQGISRLLRLVLLSDEEDTSNFSYYLRNSKLFFGNKDRHYPFEAAVYEWVIKHNQTVGREERKASYSALTEHLVPFVKNKILGAEETQLWAEAQERGISGAQVFNEKLAAAK